MLYIHGMALEHDKVFQMRASAEFLRRVDDWRREQADLPSRAEAIRRLIQLGLEAARERSGRQSPVAEPRPS
jgi:metal-responsive CopG/Arc/MetJ family transcriptional regulator